jgi:hypothetical protein
VAGVAVTGARYGIDTADQGMNSTGDLLEFLFGKKASASPAQYSVFLQVRH